MAYWQDRTIDTLTRLSTKNINDVIKQMKKYYRRCMAKTINDFIDTYKTLLQKVVTQKQITANDLYKLDKYWQMEWQIKDRLQKLGDAQITAISNAFENTYRGVYGAALPADLNFITISDEAVESAITHIWCADGLNFSNRVWNNTNKLVDRLNNHLIDCVVNGRQTTELKKLLQKDFAVTYEQANKIVRTEIAHIQTQAALDRYRDAGITQYKFLGRTEKDIGCTCKKLDGKVFNLNQGRTGINLPPIHPNCRCCISPIVNVPLGGSGVKRATID